MLSAGATLHGPASAARKTSAKRTPTLHPVTETSAAWPSMLDQVARPPALSHPLRARRHLPAVLCGRSDPVRRRGQSGGGRRGEWRHAPPLSPPSSWEGAGVGVERPIAAARRGRHRGCRRGPPRHRRRQAGPRSPPTANWTASCWMTLENTGWQTGKGCRQLKSAGVGRSGGEKGSEYAEQVGKENGEFSRWWNVRPEVDGGGSYKRTTYARSVVFVASHREMFLQQGPSPWLGLTRYRQMRSTVVV